LVKRRYDPAPVSGDLRGDGGFADRRRKAGACDGDEGMTRRIGGGKASIPVG
jgi:hypothetical protein